MTDERDPVWALCDLSWHPDAAGRFFRRGDRLDGRIPDKILADLLVRGEASYTRPTDVEPLYALRDIEHREHANVVAFRAGERVDGIDRLPAPILAHWVDEGYVGSEQPEPAS